MNDKLIFENTPAIIFIVSKDGLILDLNKAALIFVELELQKCRGQKFTSFIESNQNQVLKIFEQINENIFPKSIEAKFKLYNNKSFFTTISFNKYFNDETNEREFIVTLFDLTHHKMKAELIKESQTRFENIANSAPVMIWITDVDGFIIFVNNIWCEFTGRSVGEELGLNWIQDVHKDDVTDRFNSYQHSITNRTTFSYQFRFQRKDNVYRWMMINGIPRFNEINNFLGFIGTCIDITQQKDDEDYIKKINEELESANQNKDKFFSIISHDLRSPLSGTYVRTGYYSY